MKELSTEEKAEAYDKAIKQIKECIPDENEFITIYPQEIFPELKESEDERIRKWLIGTIKQIPDDSIEWKTICKSDVLAWLDRPSEEKSDDKIEPKFKIGDIIRLKDGDGLEWTVEGVLNNGYYTIVCADRDDFIQLDDKWELVEQKPAIP